MSNFIERTGYCYDKYTAFLGCALEPDECKDRGISGFGTKTPGERCDPNRRKMGRCQIENSCAVRASDCSIDPSESNFDEDDGMCTFQRDTSNAWDPSNPIYTQFGSCKNTVTGEYFCIYDPLDCDEGADEVYIIPAETAAAGVKCDCSEVHVTACQYDRSTDSEEDDVLCVVKSDACAKYENFKETGDPFTSISPYQQKVNRDNGSSTLDCRLCVKTILPSEPPNAPATSPTTNTGPNIPTPTTSNPNKSAGVDVFDGFDSMMLVSIILLKMIFNTL